MNPATLLHLVGEQKMQNQWQLVRRKDPRRVQSCALAPMELPGMASRAVPVELTRWHLRLVHCAILSPVSLPARDCRPSELPSVSRLLSPFLCELCVGAGPDLPRFLHRGSEIGVVKFLSSVSWILAPVFCLL